MATDVGFLKDLLPLVGVFVGATIPLLKDWINGKKAVKLERIKIHDKEKLIAYQKLYKLCIALKLVLRDNSQAVDLSFINNSYGKLYIVVENLPFYSPQIKKLILKLKDLMDSVTDNIMKTDQNAVLINSQLNQTTGELEKLVISDMNQWYY